MGDVRHFLCGVCGNRSRFRPVPELACGVMSEKRRRQQNGRAKRQSTGRSRGGAGFADRELTQMMDGMVPIVLRDVGELGDALEA
jgi:hypothetical protein